MQNSKGSTLTPDGRRIRRTNLAGSWEFLWLISCYTNDQCWPQKPHGIVKNSFRNRIDLKISFFPWKNSGFCLRKYSWKMFSVEKKWWLGQKVQKTLQLRKMFAVQNALVCLTGAAIQAPCVLCYLSPPEAGVPVTGSFLHPPGMALCCENPLQLIKRNLGYKPPPCRIASRRQGRAILNKKTLHFCISTKSNWEMLTMLAFPGFLLNYTGEPQRQTGHPQSCKVIRIKLAWYSSRKNKKEKYNNLY